MRCISYHRWQTCLTKFEKYDFDLQLFLPQLTIHLMQSIINLILSPLFLSIVKPDMHMFAYISILLPRKAPHFKCTQYKKTPLWNHERKFPLNSKIIKILMIESQTESMSDEYISAVFHMLIQWDDNIYTTES